MFNFFRMHELLFMFTMFFAAGASAIADAGTGGGDGGGGDGGADGGADSSGDDSGADAARSTSGDQDDVSAESAGDADSAETSNVDTDANATVDLGDGRQVPAKFKKLFDLAKTAGVEKEVKQLYFANARLTKAIPGGVNGAIELAKSVEQFGGVEGIQEIQGELQTHTDDAELFASGNAKWIESGFQENSDVALKHLAHGLEYAAQHHPEFYDHVVAKSMFETLDQFSPIHEVYSVLSNAASTPEQRAQAAKKLADFYNGIKSTAHKIPEKKVDEQTKALSARESKVQEQEMNLRYQQVNTKTFPVMKSVVTRTLQAEAKLVGVDLTKLAGEFPGAFEAMMEKIHKSIMATAVKDERFIDKYAALVKKGEMKRAADAINAKHEKIIPEIVRAVAKASGLLKGKATAGAQNNKGNQNAGNDQQNQSNAGWQKVSAKPRNVDYSKTDTGMLLEGKAITLDGKKVTW